jgi:hypothetical protein
MDTTRAAVSAISAAASAIIVVAATSYAYLQVREARRARIAQIQPKVRPEEAHDRRSDRGQKRTFSQWRASSAVIAFSTARGSSASSNRLGPGPSRGPEIATVKILGFAPLVRSPSTLMSIEEPLAATARSSGSSSINASFTPSRSIPLRHREVGNCSSLIEASSPRAGLDEIRLGAVNQPAPRSRG